MEFAVESLETPALTKAQLAELLFDQIGIEHPSDIDRRDQPLDDQSGTARPRDRHHRNMAVAQRAAGDALPRS